MNDCRCNTDYLCAPTISQCCVSWCSTNCSAAVISDSIFSVTNTAVLWHFYFIFEWLIHHVKTRKEIKKWLSNVIVVVECGLFCCWVRRQSIVLFPQWHYAWYKRIRRVSTLHSHSALSKSGDRHSCSTVSWMTDHIWMSQDFTFTFWGV